MDTSMYGYDSTYSKQIQNTLVCKIALHFFHLSTFAFLRPRNDSVGSSDQLMCSWVHAEHYAIVHWIIIISVPKGRRLPQVFRPFSGTHVRPDVVIFTGQGKTHFLLVFQPENVVQLVLMKSTTPTKGK